jgi:peptidyl-prolyl cis-trans isomerase SurA
MIKDRSVKTVAALAVALFIMYTLTGDAAAFLIDRIDAVVNGRVITRSEVDRAFDAEVLRLTSEGKKPAPDLRKEVLDSLINRILILEDAKKFNLVQVTEEEVDKAYDSVRQGFPSGEAFLAALDKEGITPAELKENLRDQVLAAKYVDRRIRSFVRVTLEDQKKYYEENRVKFGDKSFEKAQEEINSLLVEREAGKKLDDYLNELRAKSSIQLMDAEKMRD